LATTWPVQNSNPYDYVEKRYRFAVYGVYNRMHWATGCIKRVGVSHCQSSLQPLTALGSLFKKVINSTGI
jgi:hypothetical protein